jgi:hypothetical protein
MPCLAVLLHLLLPPAADLELFPPAPVVDWARQEAYQHLGSHWQSQAPPAWLCWGQDVTAWRADQRYCWSCWNTLDDAHRGRGTLACRWHLGRLRTLLGAECYHTGGLPPPWATNWYRRCE